VVPEPAVSSPVLPELDALLADAVTTEWLKGRSSLSPLEAMNSSTWVVDASSGRHVLKISSPTDRPGLEAAAWLEGRGWRTGAPLRTSLREGRLVALLRFVEGRPLSYEDPEAVGETLGRVHSMLVDAPVPAGMDRWPWSWLDPAVIGEPALRSAAMAAIDRAERLAPRLTHGILHGDPMPEAFLNAEGDIGLIDWGAACHGPLLYDVASAWMYVRKNERLIDAYARTGPLDRDELAHTPEFFAFRLALQAWYFSVRLAANDLTGVAGQADNDRGLAHAREGLL
jgi:Ser/Thr protein kinase RdoA (MazF antagonist)